MGRMKLGHDQRGINKNHVIVTGKLPSAVDFNTILELHKAELIERLDAIKPQPEVLATMAPQTVTHTKEIVVKELSTQDKLARRHSKLIRLKMDKALGEITESMSEQDELFHILKRGIHNLVEKNNALEARLQILEANKVQEKQIVTERQIETVVKTIAPKFLMAGVILSLALSIFAILTH